MGNQNYFYHKSAVIDEGVCIGENTDIWHFTHVMPGAHIGKNCTLGQSVFVGKNVVIGNNVKVQNNVNLYEGVELEDDVFCGPSMVFTNVNKPRSNRPTDSDDYEKTHVGRGATLGANATIICGNDIGKWAFVGAGSVVTKEIPAHGLFMGNPARQHGWACRCGEFFNNLNQSEGTIICSGCNQKYKYDPQNFEPVDET